MMHQDETREHFFRDLIFVDELLSGLDSRLGKDLTFIEKPLRVLPDEIVFAVGDRPLSIYIHRIGRVALFQNGGIKDIVYPCPVGPKCIYGLIEAMAGNAYGMSMKTLTNSEFDVIDRDKLLSFIQNQPALCFRLAEILSRKYQRAMQTIKTH